jgi:hypothetical protein
MDNHNYFFSLEKSRCSPADRQEEALKKGNPLRGNESQIKKAKLFATPEKVLSCEIKCM